MSHATTNAKGQPEFVFIGESLDAEAVAELQRALVVTVPQTPEPPERAAPTPPTAG